MPLPLSLYDNEVTWNQKNFGLSAQKTDLICSMYVDRDGKMPRGQLEMMRGARTIFQHSIPCLWAAMDGSSGEVVGLWLNVTAGETDCLKVDGPEERIVQLYDALRPSLYRYLINIGVSPADVEEIVQESFLRLYQHMRSGGNEDNLRSWIFKVAHNLSVNILRGRRRQIEITPELWEQLSQSTQDRVPGPEEQLLQKERLRHIHDGLAALTPLQRDCLNLRVEGFRYREIGEILNVGTSTVASSLRNAITQILKRRA